jgi:hypothetical protein
MGGLQAIPFPHPHLPRSCAVHNCSSLALLFPLLTPPCHPHYPTVLPIFSGELAHIISHGDHYRSLLTGSKVSPDHTAEIFQKGRLDHIFSLLKTPQQFPIAFSVKVSLFLTKHTRRFLIKLMPCSPTHLLSLSLTLLPPPTHTHIPNYL